MSDLILVTGSRDASPAMLNKVLEVVRWVQTHNHALIVGDAPGVDAAVRRACHKLSVMLFVYGGYNRIRGPEYPGEQHSTVDGDYLARDRVMGHQCTRAVAIMRAPKTGGTWYTGRYIESLIKRVRWAVWDDAKQVWAYYNHSQEMAGTVRARR